MDLHCNYLRYLIMQGEKFYLYIINSDIDEAEVISGSNRQGITPDFGAGSLRFILKPYTHIFSTDEEDGWGGWQHPYGHHNFYPCMEDQKPESIPTIEASRGGYLNDALYLDVAAHLAAQGTILTLENFKRKEDFKLYCEKVLNGAVTFYGEINILEESNGNKKAYSTTDESANWLNQTFEEDSRLEILARYPVLDHVTVVDESLIKLAWEGHEAV